MGSAARRATMAMFFGEHQHTLDEKGRLTLPARWRSVLAGGVVLTRGLDRCLFIFPKAKFEAIAAEIDAQGLELNDARTWARYFLGMAVDLEVDRQGRILIPENLRKFAGVDGNVVCVGVVSRLEVWNPKRYHSANRLVESDPNVVAERIGKLLRKAGVRGNE